MNPNYGVPNRRSMPSRGAMPRSHRNRTHSFNHHNGHHNGHGASNRVTNQSPWFFNGGGVNNGGNSNGNGGGLGSLNGNPGGSGVNSGPNANNKDLDMPYAPSPYQRDQMDRGWNSGGNNSNSSNHHHHNNRNNSVSAHGVDFTVKTNRVLEETSYSIIKPFQNFYSEPMPSQSARFSDLFGNDSDRGDRHRLYGYGVGANGNNALGGNSRDNNSGIGGSGVQSGSGNSGNYYDSSSNSSNSLKSDSPSRKRRRVSRLPSQSPPIISPRSGNVNNSLRDNSVSNGHGLISPNHSQSLHQLGQQSSQQQPQLPSPPQTLRQLQQPQQPLISNGNRSQLPSPPPMRRLHTRENLRRNNSNNDSNNSSMSTVYQQMPSTVTAAGPPMPHLVVHRHGHPPHHHVHHEPPPTAVHHHSWPYTTTPRISICSAQIVPPHHIPPRTLASAVAAAAVATITQQQQQPVPPQVTGPSPYGQVTCVTGSQPGAAFGGLAAATATNMGRPHLTTTLPGPLHYHNHHYHPQQQGAPHAATHMQHNALDGLDGSNVRGLIHTSPGLGHHGHHGQHNNHSVPHSFSAAAAAGNVAVGPPPMDIIHHPSSTSSRRTMPNPQRSQYATWVRWQNTGQNHVHHTIHRHSGRNPQMSAPHHHRHHHHHNHRHNHFQALAAAAAAGATSVYMSNATSVSSGFLLNFLTLLPLSPYGQAELGSPDSPEENYEALLQVAERLGEVKPRGLGRLEIDQLCSYKFNAETHTGEY